MSVLTNFLEILLCVYGVIKYIFRKYLSICKNKNLASVLELPYVIITLLVYLLIIVAVTPFKITRKLLDFSLKMIYGPKYRGLLKNLDALWMVDVEQSKNIINGFLVVQLTNSPEEFLKHYRKKIKDSQKVQFNTTVHNILNCWYRLESDDILERVVKVVDFEEGESKYKDKFDEKLSKICNLPLPKNELFEIFLSSKPLELFNNQYKSNNNYVMIGRLHHSLGDGINLLRYLLEHLTDQGTTPLESKINGIYSKSDTVTSSKHSHYLKTIKNTFKYINRIPDIINDVSVYHFAPVESADDNILHGAELCGDKNLVYFIEEKARYISKIKAIKNQFGGRFSDVLYTVLSASLFKYFQEHDENNIPSNIHLSFITQSPREENDPDYMNSKLCTVTLELPIKINDAKDDKHSLIKRLNIIVARDKLLHKSIDSLLFYWTVKHCYLLPGWLVRILYRLMLKSTISISNLPGLDTVTINGEVIKDMMFWVPNVSKLGVGLTILSYDGRLQIGLSADKALIPRREQALGILENCCKYLDLLSEEIN